MGIDEKLEELKKITQKLDDENISLEAGVKLFESGAQLAKECFEVLNETKGKITKIKKDIESYSEVEFTDKN